jgi:IS30 family transposase
MKAQHNITQIARLLRRYKSTISRELRRDVGCRSYKAKQACELACKRSESSRNASTLAAPWMKEQASALLKLQWSPEQIAGKLPVSHELLYLHVYADKAHGGTLWKNLRCQKQKRKRYASGRDRRGQIPNRRPLSERPAFIDKRLQGGSLGRRHRHWCGPQAGHRDIGGAQKWLCGHGQGFKQDVGLGWLGDHPSAQAV